MKSFLIGLLFFILGGVVGGFGAFSVGTGMGAGVGIATGFAAGSCSVLETLKEKGLVADDQFGEVLQAAVKQISSHVDVSHDAVTANTAADCEKVLTELQNAVQAE